MSNESFFDKVKDFIQGHPEQADQALDRGAEILDERTGGQYADQIAKGDDLVRQQFGLPEGQAIEPAPTPGDPPAVPGEPTPTPGTAPEPPTVPTPTEPTTAPPVPSPDPVPTAPPETVPEATPDTNADPGGTR